MPIEAREPEVPADSLVLRKSSFVIDACRLIDRVARANAIHGAGQVRRVPSGIASAAEIERILAIEPANRCHRPAVTFITRWELHM